MPKKPAIQKTLPATPPAAADEAAQGVNELQIEDYAAKIENTLRTTGAWAHAEGVNKQEHYFKAKNKAINTAISLCGQIVTTIDRVHPQTPIRKCLVCALFQESSKTDPPRIGGDDTIEET